MATADRSTRPAERASADSGTAEPVDDSRPRRTLASYPTYAEAERAVDWLSDQGFAVEHVAIVGKGLRSVEQVARRMTAGRAALVGAGQGALIGALFAFLFGIFFTGPGFGGLLLYAVVVGALFGALFGALGHEVASGGRRDFVSDMSIAADRYEVQAEEDVADDAKWVLAAMPGK
jgi:hypothetical protein